MSNPTPRTLASNTTLFGTTPFSTQYHSPNDFLKSARPTVLTTDLEASVCEYQDCLGFKLVRHIPHTAALLVRDGVRVQLLRRYAQYEKHVGTSPVPHRQPTHRIAVENIFDLYHSLAQKLRPAVSGPPRLTLLGTWEFTFTDHQQNQLFFVQAVVNGVFSLAFPSGCWMAPQPGAAL